MKKEHVAVVEMLLCSVLWSIAGIFIKLIPWNAIAIAGFRSLFSALTMLIYMGITRQRIRFNKNVVVSMVLLCSTFLAFVGANKLTTSANAIVLQFVAPVFILIYGAVFLHQKLTVLDTVTVFLTLGGIALFAIDGMESGHALGNAIGLLAGLFMAGMFICAGSTHGEEKMSGLLFGHLLTAAIGVPFAFFTPTAVNTVTVSSVIILGVVQLGIPYILLALASDYCPPLACSLLSVVEPLLNPVWVALFANEYPSALALVGGAVVLVTVTAWCILKDRQGKKISLPKGAED